MPDNSHLHRPNLLAFEILRLRGSVVTEQVGALALKGLTQPVVAYNVPLAAILPSLHVIEGGPQSV